MKTELVLVAAVIWFANTTTSFQPVIRANDVPAKASKAGTVDFAFLRTHRQGKGVAATWGLTASEGVTGFLVQRTYEDATDPYAMWEDLASIPYNDSRSFKYTDPSVFPGFIHYRIVALLADGTSVTSEISDVRIVSH
jgi:hypothetical protein